MVQPESASPFDVFGLSAIEVVEEIQTVLAPELMKDVTIGDDEFEETFSFIKGTSDFMDPLISFDILLGFISCLDDVYDSVSMDLSICLSLVIVFIYQHPTHPLHRYLI